MSKAPRQHVTITQQVRNKNADAVGDWLLRAFTGNKEESLEFLKQVSEWIYSAPALPVGTEEFVGNASDPPAAKRPRVENPEFPFLETDPEMASKETLVYLLFPNSVVGAIIGKGAINMKEINRRSGARVQVEKNPWGESRMVIVKGTLREVILGIHFVADFAGTEDMYMLVPNKVCGLIIGAKGANIKEMSTVTGATMKMELENEDVRRLFISGELMNRCHAVYSVACVIIANAERIGPFDPRQKIYANTIPPMPNMPQEVQFDPHQIQQAGLQHQAAIQQLQLQQLRQLQAQSQFGGPSGF